MNELLTLCGFEAKELDSQLPRIEKAFHKLGITAGDIEIGKQRLKKYYDIDLQGVRQAIALSVRDVVDTILAREEGKKKIIPMPGMKKKEMAEIVDVVRSNQCKL